MKYPFLENNELVIVDYLPGSSGHLLLRLWAELDATMDYNNENILLDTPINSHPSSREIDYDIVIPKRIVTWFIDKCEPNTIHDYVQFFEFLSTTLIAKSQPWVHGTTNKIFYKDVTYILQNVRVIYGIHSWDKIIPYKEMQNLGYKIKCISVVPQTDAGLRYQHNRFNICFPNHEEKINKLMKDFNNKPTLINFDFCTLLVNKDTDAILDWFKTQLGEQFRIEKEPRIKEILNDYYSHIINNI